MTHETEVLRVSFVIPGEAPSSLNLREHWAAKSDRHKAIQSKVRLVAPRWQGPAPVCIRLTRTGYRRLDGDNLQGALKAHRDAVAAQLRIDDATPLVEWQYEQVTDSDEKNHGVAVEILTRGHAAPLSVPPVL